MIIGFPDAGEKLLCSDSMSCFRSPTITEFEDLVAYGEKKGRVLYQTWHSRYNAAVDAAGWTLMPSDTAIQPLVIGDNEAALTVMAALREQGIWVPAIRPPTVPAGTARLRITLCASHTEADVERLLQVLRDAAAEAQVSQPEGADA